MKEIRKLTNPPSTMNRSQNAYSKKTILLLPILILFSFLFLLIFSTNTSPIFDGDWGDYTIYKYLGFGILNGKLPYVDLFDNKGPLLYLINAIGQIFPPLGRWGLFSLQVISLSISLFYIYLIINILDKKKKTPAI